MKLLSACPGDRFVVGGCLKISSFTKCIFGAASSENLHSVFVGELVGLFSRLSLDKRCDILGISHLFGSHAVDYAGKGKLPDDGILWILLLHCDWPFRKCDHCLCS